MEFSISCECGHEISGFTRSNTFDANFQVECDECDAAYAVTVTQLHPAK